VIVYGSVDDDLGTLSPTLVEAEILPCYVKEEKSFLWINRKSRSVTNFSRERRKKKKKRNEKNLSVWWGEKIFFLLLHTRHTNGRRSSKEALGLFIRRCSNKTPKREEKKRDPRIGYAYRAIQLRRRFPHFFYFYRKYQFYFYFFLNDYSLLILFLFF
jgi:hypothetical protein